MTDEHNDNNKEIEIKNDYENKTENTKTNEIFPMKNFLLIMSILLKIKKNLKLIL